MPAPEQEPLGLLATIHWRLEEVLALFAAHRSMHQLNGKSVDVPLAAALNRFSGFWHPVSVGLQTALFVGIVAILDKNSTESATLYSAIRGLNSLERAKLPAHFETNLDAIHRRYKTYRHKLFGHNDRKRDAVLDEFTQAGFTWTLVEADLQELVYSLKVLYAIRESQAIPEREQSNSIIFQVDLAHAHARLHSAEFFAWYKSAIATTRVRST
jgi:hypothetical protein